MAVYGDELRGTLPDGVTGAAADAATGSLGAAAAVADELPAGVAEPLMAAARLAFAQGFTTTAAVGAVLVGITAVLAVVLLRRVRPGAAAVVEPAG